jgi:diadenosine tetraphosphate (Ap4A) HIT family hydrolase
VLPRGAQVQGVADTACYLCTDNIRWQHRAVQGYYQYSVNDRVYNALCNPFPFTRTHLTMAAGEHLPQSFHVTGDPAQTHARIRRIVEDLYAITEQLPTFVGFYNGAGAGASIEKHLHFHFFEIPDGHGGFPIQTAARLATRTLFGQARSDRPASIVSIPDYPLTAYQVRGARADAIEAVVDLAVDWDRRAGEAASANIIALREEDAVSLYFVPRNKFYTRSPGLAGMVAGLETLGEFIFSTPEEQRAINEQRVNYDYLWRILEAVRPSEDGEQS